MIEVKNLTKYYGSKAAIEDVTFKVEKGEIVGFLGPNGAGKTTTMRILTCFLAASSGTATIEGYDIFSHSLEVRRRIGYLPEHPPLYLEMTVKSYLKFIARIKDIPRRQHRDKILSVVEKTGLKDYYSARCGSLSKGFRQRVGLAQALIHDPPVLIMDEPTSGLDPIQIVGIRKLIKGLAGEHTVILSTHILPEVGMTSTKVIIISDGRIVAVDTPENLIEQIRKTDVVQIEVHGGTAREIKNKLLKVTGIINAEILHGSDDGKHLLRIEMEKGVDVRPDIARVIFDNNNRLYEMRNVGMSLEDIFLKITIHEEEA